MKKKKIFGNGLKEQLIASRRDRLHHFTMAGAKIRGVAVHGTRMINEMRWNHELGILETLVLGQAYLGAALMSAGLKGDDRLAIHIDCSGPIKGLSVEASAFGEIRGYLKQVPIPIDKPLESFDLSPFFGAGFLSVTKVLENSKNPFVGKVMLEHGRLAKDLAVYHMKSEQVHSAFSLSVSFDPQGEVQGAGGLMLQAMPGADEQELALIEEQLHALPSIGKAVNDPDFPQTYVNKGFADFDPKFLGQRGVEFMCHCTDKRIVSMLNMLGQSELDDMAANGPFPVQVRCHYCNTMYEYTQEQVKEIASHHTGS